jgi:hypothetical protein
MLPFSTVSTQPGHADHAFVAVISFWRDYCLVIGMASHGRVWGEGISMLRFFIGLGVPFIAIVGMLPVVNKVAFTFFNVPFLYLWMFSWFILSSVCLGICWLCFDRHRPEF